MLEENRIKKEPGDNKDNHRRSPLMAALGKQSKNLTKSEKSPKGGERDQHQK